MDNKKSGSQHFKEKVWRVVGGRIAQWQSIGLQFPWSLVRIRLCPFFSSVQKGSYLEEKRVKRRYQGFVVKWKNTRFGCEWPGFDSRQSPLFESGEHTHRARQRKNRERYHIKALQLSGKIPAQGAGGAGSIPAKALFLSQERNTAQRKRRKEEET